MISILGRDKTRKAPSLRPLHTGGTGKAGMIFPVDLDLATNPKEDTSAAVAFA